LEQFLFFFPLRIQKFNLTCTNWNYHSRNIFIPIKIHCELHRFVTLYRWGFSLSGWLTSPILIPLTWFATFSPSIPNPSPSFSTSRFPISFQLSQPITSRALIHTSRFYTANLQNGEGLILECVATQKILPIPLMTVTLPHTP
jgi:hypothetical protein